MTQLDLIPTKRFSEIAEENLRRYAISQAGNRNRTLKANKDAVTACLRAEVNRGKSRVKAHRRVRKSAADQGLPV